MKPPSELTPGEAAEWVVANLAVPGVREQDGHVLIGEFWDRRLFNPLGDERDALAMRAAWCGAAPGRWPCLTMGSDAGIWTVVLVEGTWQVSATDTFMAAIFAAVYAAVESENEGD